MVPARRFVAYRGIRGWCSKGLISKYEHALHVFLRGNAFHGIIKWETIYLDDACFSSRNMAPVFQR